MEPQMPERDSGYNLLIFDVNASDKYNDITGESSTERQIPIERLDSMQRNFLKYFQ
jgi:hypothetical protein